MYRYTSHAWDQAYLMKRIREIVSIRLRYGYRRIHILLKREEWQVNHKRIFRLYRREGLQMRLKPLRRRVSIKTRREPVFAKQRNECWSMDFMTDELYDGHRTRILTIVDNFTLESICASVRHQFTGIDVANTLEELIKLYGKPQIIQVDNGSEFISKEMDL